MSMELLILLKEMKLLLIVFLDIEVSNIHSLIVDFQR